MDWLTKFIEKITNQSTLIVIIAFAYSYFALRNQQSFFSPLVITGFISFGAGLFLLLGNFFINQVSEGYKYIIEEMKGVINTLKSQTKFSEKFYKEKLTTSSTEKDKSLEKIGYTAASDIESTKVE